MLKSRRVLVAVLTVIMLLSAALPLGMVAAQDDAEWVVYASELGYFVQHPADWVAGEDEDGVMLANSQAAFDKMAADDSDDDGPAAGEVGMAVLVLDLAEMGLPADTGLDMLFDLVISNITEDGMQAAGDPETLELDGVEARTLEVKDAESDTEGLLVLTIKEGALIIGVQANAAGETAEYVETALMIIGSVAFEAPEDGGAMDGGSLLDSLTGGGEALSQTFDSMTGVSFDYPEGWVAGDSDGQAVAANNQTVYDKLDAGGEENNPVAGEAGVVVVGLGLAELGLPADTSVDTVFNMFIGAMTGEGLETTSEPEAIMLGDVDAIKVYITDTDGGGEGVLVVMIKDDALILGILVTAQDGVPDFEATALDIIGSATYTAPAP
jgi:hypothetical protein